MVSEIITITAKGTCRLCDGKIQRGHGDLSYMKERWWHLANGLETCPNAPVVDPINVVEFPNEKVFDPTVRRNE